MKKLRVNLKDKSYPILMEKGLLKKMGRLLELNFKPSSIHIVTDRNLSKLHLAKLQKGFRLETHSYAVPVGERSKSLNQYEKLCREIVRTGVDRKALIVAFGGGVVGDLAGFVAASLLRGLDYVQIPTTLLAQVDSSIGGKVALDLPEGKNLIGAFHQPKMVLIDPELLKTLPHREIKNAYAELLKIALVKDHNFFNWLEKNAHLIIKKQMGPVLNAVRISCKLKAQIVSEDEREAGLRALLNLGHSFGHAFEAASDFKILHGEAVSLGLVYAAALSNSQGRLSEAAYQRLLRHMTKMAMPMTLEALSLGKLSAQSILRHMKKDKKNISSEFRLVLLNSIGKGECNIRISKADLLNFLKDQKLGKRVQPPGRR